MSRALALAGAGLLGLCFAGAASAEERVVEVLLPDRAALQRLAAAGADLDHGVSERNGKLVVPFVGEDAEIDLLRAQGYEIGNELYGETISRRRLAERDRAIEAKKAKAEAQDVSAEEGVKILNAPSTCTTSVRSRSGSGPAASR